MNRKEIADIRREYGIGPLSEDTVSPCPSQQFRTWLKDALAANFHDPNAMVLSSVSSEGKPSSRIVLLKGFSEAGFQFYTNYQSRKGQELAENPFVSLVFWWDKLERQVRIEGQVKKVSREESEKYFHSRPRQSQLGAWSSQQSRVIENSEVLKESYKNITEEFENQEVPLPDYWGGYCVIPESIEFWQGQPGRLHDRLNYQLQSDGSWQIVRLSP